MAKRHTIKVPGDVFDLMVQVQTRLQNKRGVRLYKYQVIGELCGRWLRDAD